MRQFIYGCVIVAAISSPAHATKISNLDRVPHTVVITAFGQKETRSIAPGSTEFFMNVGDGRLSLQTTQQPKGNSGTLHSDGLLSGIVGAARSEGIPIGPRDSYAIWPGGKLMLQGRKKDQGRF
jgi:hypothetical protein